MLYSTNHKDRTSGFYHIISDGSETVDAKNPFDLHKQSMYEAKIVTGDPHYCRNGLNIGEIGIIKVELPPFSGQHECQLFILQSPVGMREANSAKELGS